MDTGTPICFLGVSQSMQQLDHCLKEAREKMPVLSSAAHVFTGSSSPGSLAALLCLLASADGFPFFPSPSCHKNLFQPQMGREKWGAGTWPRGVVSPPDGVEHSLPFPFLWMYSRKQRLVSGWKRPSAETAQPELYYSPTTI